MARLTEAEFRMLGQGRTKPDAKPAPTKRRGNMNKTEARFKLWLCANYPSARIDFEPERFRLADGTNYTPDFRVVNRHCYGDVTHFDVGFFEVKPKARLRTERDGIVRLKWAAQLNPMYEFFLVRPDGDRWLIKRVADVDE